MFDLVLGTGNVKKLAELQSMLASASSSASQQLSLTALGEIPEAIDVVEDAETFGGNAAKKATEQAVHLSAWVLAEDSGLSVPALGGAPGVYSARYAGEHGDDAGNNAKLLAELEGVPPERRDAFYSCHLCLSDPAGNVRLEANGRCGGRIGTRRCGDGGFGYDSLFIVPEYHRTFGELAPVVKRALSHRSRALRKFIPGLLRIAAANG